MVSSSAIAAPSPLPVIAPVIAVSPSPALAALPSPVPAVEPAPSPSPKKQKARKKRTDSSSNPSSANTKSSRPGTALPPLLKEVEEKYSKSPTLVADFTQVNEMVAMNQKKTSSGTIEIKRPDKVRWETKSPDANVLVSDGKHFWFYTPPFDESEHGQLIERRAAQVQSKLAQALLSGRFSDAKGMKISAETKSRFKLIPKAGTAGDVVKATIDVDQDKKLIQKVMLFHKDGNKSEITLKNIELDRSLEDSEFVFKAPPNTDRVTE